MIHWGSLSGRPKVAIRLEHEATKSKGWMRHIFIQVQQHLSLLTSTLSVDATRFLCSEKSEATLGFYCTSVAMDKWTRKVYTDYTVSCTEIPVSWHCLCLVGWRQLLHVPGWLEWACHWNRLYGPSITLNHHVNSGGQWKLQIHTATKLIDLKL